MHDFNDFTFNSYRNLLKRAKELYQFRFFYDFCQGERFVLWRHDIDFAVQRAVKLAQIESEECIKSTFFVHLHSYVYNFFEKTVVENIREIIALGHEIGLHFDCHFYDELDSPNLITYLLREKQTLEDTYAVEIKAFSFHNPSNMILINDSFHLAGMVNTYAKYFREEVGYISDSNGIWRFKSLGEVLDLGIYDRLQVLTHPVWWTEKPMSPKARIMEYIEQRAEWMKDFYLSRRARLMVDEDSSKQKPPHGNCGSELIQSSNKPD